MDSKNNKGSSSLKLSYEDKLHMIFLATGEHPYIYAKPTKRPRVDDVPTPGKRRRKASKN